jgi:3-hydroxyisobutyrate dehydrogenase
MLSDNAAMTDSGKHQTSPGGRRRSASEHQMTGGATRVAFAGLGRMGAPMCAALARAGFDVVATDLRPELRAEVGAMGARWASSITAAVSSADLLITVLPGPWEVTAVIDEVLGSLPAGSCWLEMSTASPRVAQAIVAAAQRRGVRAIDAPVAGGPEQARGGKLVAFAGGDNADLRAVRPVFDVLAERVVHTGPNGSGYAVKLLSNALWFMQAVGTAEVLALARQMGLDLEVVLGALDQSAAASRFLGHDARALLDGDDLTTFSLARCCQELTSVLALGDELDVPLDVMSVVTELHAAALERYGDVDGELLAARWIAERSGVDFRK